MMDIVQSMEISWDWIWEEQFDSDDGGWLDIGSCGMVLGHGWCLDMEGNGT